MHGTYSVNRRMMDLEIGGKLTILQAFNQVHLPQWTGPIQQSPMQSGSQCKQFTISSRLGQGRVANVVIQVQFVIRLPVNVTEQTQRTGFDFAAKRMTHWAFITQQFLEFCQE